MKKCLLGLLLVLLVGCSSTDKKGETKEVKQEITTIKNSSFKNLPEWVLQPTYTSVIAAVGQAKIGKAGLSFAKTEALANARNEIARQVEVQVDNMFTSYLNTTGIGSDETVDKVATDVSKQVASLSLKGSKQLNVWISEEDDVYILVGVDNSTLNKEVKESVVNQKALYQEIKAKQAQDDLETAVNAKFKMN